MSLWVDIKYAKMLSNILVGYKIKQSSPLLVNCRCPLCLDSQANKKKARGYLYERTGKVFFHCHNCGQSKSLKNFLYLVERGLYDQYKMETLLETNPRFVADAPVKEEKKKPVFEPLKKLKKISQLLPGHPAKDYVEKRQIPSNTHYKLYYCPRFYEWINSILPDKFSPESLRFDGPRLLIPFFDKEGKCYGVSGRALYAAELRYITIMFDEDKPKVFGLDSVDLNDKTYVVEGPIDSLFLPNSLAMVGADINLENIGLKNKFVVIYDNEPRNAQIMKRLEKTIKMGYNVVIWPDGLAEKDINDMVLSGLKVEDIINGHTFKGLRAELELARWKKT